MKPTKVTAIYFSPTGSTKRIVQAAAGGTGFPFAEFDITPYAKRDETFQFGQDDLVILGTPVFGGRIPPIALPRFQNIKGNGTPVIAVAVYGNRDYDDALLELKTVAEANGFIVIAAGAFIAEHSVAHKIGAGRPDEKDMAAVKAFGKEAAEKLETIDASDLQSVAVKGNLDYRPYHSLPMVPKANRKCNACGTCVRECPADAIHMEQVKTADKEKCLACMRCVAICPQDARDISKVMKAAAHKLISSKCAGEKQPEIFI